MERLAALPDDALLPLLQGAQKEQAAQVLFDRYAPLLMGTCLRYLNDHNASQDATLEIFEKIIFRIHEFEVTHFKSWLYQVTRNHCLMELRRQKMQQRHLQAWQEDFLASTMENAPYVHLTDSALSDDDLRRLHEAIAQLVPTQRQCIELFYLAGKSYQEISDTTGYPLNAVKSYLQNGKRNLQKQLLPVGLLWIVARLPLLDTIEFYTGF